MQHLPPTGIKTQRLLLRPWKQEDLEPFARLNADPRVMECFPATLSRDESDQFVKKRQGQIEEQGWGAWAVSVPGVADFVGYIGLVPVPYEAHFTPAIEVGWRLAHEYWGNGYALEGARAALQFAFTVLALDQIVSITVPANQRSRRVMEKLGMHSDPKDNFEHPRLKNGDPLRPHVLYRLKREEWCPPAGFEYKVERIENTRKIIYILS